MKHWPVQDAKARFSELLEASVKEGPQMVTRRGVETAVVVPIEEWRRLTAERLRNRNRSVAERPRRFELDLPNAGELFSMRRPARASSDAMYAPGYERHLGIRRPRPHGGVLAWIRFARPRQFDIRCSYDRRNSDR